MCGSMVDIQSAAAEIRRGKKERRREKETTGQKYNGLPYYIGQPLLAHYKNDRNIATKVVEWDDI